MNKQYTIFVTLFLFIIIQVSQRLYSETPTDIITFIKFKNYSFNIVFLLPWFQRISVPFVQLNNDFTHKKIATFQLPKEFPSTEMPKVSQNQHFLLILNATWSFFYKEKPEAFEWILFDLQKGKKIRTFPQNAKPYFIDNNTIGFNETDRYTIEAQGFFNRIVNAIKSIFPIQKQKIEQPKFLPTTTKTETFVTQQPPAESYQLPVKQQEETESTQKPSVEEKSITVQKNSISRPITPVPPQQITLSKQSQSRKTAQQSIVLFQKVAKDSQQFTASSSPQYIRTTIIDSLNFLISIAQQSENVQTQWIQKYIDMTQKNIIPYRAAFQIALFTQITPETTTYEHALSLLERVDEQSTFMQSAEVNSLETINDLVNIIKEFALVWLELTPEEEQLLLKEMMPIINKHKTLYQQIINSMQKTGQTTTATLSLQAQKLLKEIERASQALQDGKVVPLEGIKKIVTLATTLDTLYPHLPKQVQADIVKQQKAIVQAYSSTYNNALKTNIESGWKSYGSDIIKVTAITCVTGMTSAFMSIASQNTQMLSGGPATLDVNKVIADASLAVLAHIMTELTQKKLGKSAATLIGGATAAVVTESAIIPYMQQTSVQTFVLKAPSFLGPIRVALSYEAFNIINAMIERQGGIVEIIKKIDFKKFLLRPQEASRNEITHLFHSKIVSLIHNEQISLVVADMGWKIFTASLIGCGMYAAGLGHTQETTLLEGLFYSSLDGVKRGLFSSLFARGTYHAGAMITVPAMLALPATEMINSLAKGAEIIVDPKQIVPDVIAATMQSTVDYIVDETGFINTLSEVGSNIYKSISSFYAWWSDTETEEAFAYGSV